MAGRQFGPSSTWATSRESSPFRQSSISWIDLKLLPAAFISTLVTRAPQNSLRPLLNHCRFQPMNAEGAFRMNKANLTCLLASPDPALLPLIEPILLDSGRRVEVALSAQTALDLIEANASLALALIDANLQGMDIGPLLNRARASCTNGFPIVLITDTVTQEWIDRVSEGLLDDLILRAENPAYWQVRLRMALQTHRQGRNLKALREKFARNARLDRLTGVFNREALLLALSREIRHVRRTNGALSLLLLDIDDFGHWNLRLGTEGCDE